MTTAEGFSWLACISIGALAWLAAGIPGTLCLIAGMIISQIDVGWIDPVEEDIDLATQIVKDPEPPKPKKLRKRRSANVIPFRRKAS